MNVDSELDLWKREWQQHAKTSAGLSNPLELRKRVERQSRTMRIMVAADIAVTVGIGGWTLLWALTSREADVALLAAATWFFIAVAWAFRFLNGRGSWAPAALNRAAFIDLTIRRCHVRLRTIPFGAALYILELGFCLPWVYFYNRPGTPFWAWLFGGSSAVDIVWLVTIPFFAALYWYRRRTLSELRYWHGLANEASGSEPFDIE